MKKKLLTALLIGTLAITGCGSDKKTTGNEAKTELTISLQKKLSVLMV